jgi:hypothetical protein
MVVFVSERQEAARMTTGLLRVWVVVMGAAIALAGTVPAAHAAPKAVLVSRLPPNQTAGPNFTGCDFADDAMSLMITDDGKELAAEDFCSSFGKAKASMVADQHGRNYALLEYTEGRAPNGVSTYLMVFRVATDLVSVVRIPLSWGTGPTQRFTYAYDAGSDQAGGLSITLRGTEEAGSDCCVPPEKVETIRIDAGE